MLEDLLKTMRDKGIALVHPGGSLSEANGGMFNDKVHASKDGVQVDIKVPGKSTGGAAAEEQSAETGEMEKEYLGSNGSDKYFYLVKKTDASGGTQDLLVLDSEDNELASATALNMDTNNIQSFIQDVVKRLEMSMLSFDVVEKYFLQPAVDQTEDKEDEANKAGDQEDSGSSDRPKPKPASKNKKPGMSGMPGDREEEEPGKVAKESKINEFGPEVQKKRNQLGMGPEQKCCTCCGAPLSQTEIEAGGKHCFPCQKGNCEKCGASEKKVHEHDSGTPVQQGASSVAGTLSKTFLVVAKNPDGTWGVSTSMDPVKGAGAEMKSGFASAEEAMRFAYNEAGDGEDVILAEASLADMGAVAGQLAMIKARGEKKKKKKKVKECKTVFDNMNRRVGEVVEADGKFIFNADAILGSYKEEASCLCELESFLKGKGMRIIDEKKQGLIDPWTAKKVAGAKKPGEDSDDVAESLLKKYKLTEDKLIFGKTADEIIDGIYEEENLGIIRDALEYYFGDAEAAKVSQVMDNISEEANLGIIRDALEMYADGMTEGKKKKKWIQKAFKKAKRKGTAGKCTGKKFGSDSCPVGSKAYNMAKNLKKFAKRKKNESIEEQGPMPRSEQDKADGLMGKSTSPLPDDDVFKPQSDEQVRSHTGARIHKFPEREALELLIADAEECLSHPDSAVCLDHLENAIAKVLDVPVPNPEIEEAGCCEAEEVFKPASNDDVKARAQKQGKEVYGNKTLKQAIEDIVHYMGEAEYSDYEEFLERGEDPKNHIYSSVLRLQHYLDLGERRLCEEDPFKPMDPAEKPARDAASHWATCDVCKKKMSPANEGCWGYLQDSKGQYYRRQRYGDEGGDTSMPCGDCNVEGGGFHHMGCDSEHCPKCGDQLIGCNCGWTHLTQWAKPVNEDGTKHVTFDEKKLQALKTAYEQAVKDNKDIFTFDGNEYVKDYAKYLIEYLEMKFGGANEATVDQVYGTGGSIWGPARPPARTTATGSNPSTKTCAICGNDFVPYGHSETADGRTLCRDCRQAAGDVKGEVEEAKDKRLVIMVKGGVVQDVKGLPKGWDFYVDDTDEPGVKEPKPGPNTIVVRVWRGIVDRVENLPTGYDYRIDDKDVQENVLPGLLKKHGLTENQTKEGCTMSMKELLKATTAAGMKLVEGAEEVKHGTEVGKASASADKKVYGKEKKQSVTGMKAQDKVGAQKESVVKEESGTDEQSNATIKSAQAAGAASASTDKSVESGSASDQSKTASAEAAKNKDTVKDAQTKDGGEFKADMAGMGAAKTA